MESYVLAIQGTTLGCSSPNSACTEGVLAECNKISMKGWRSSHTHFDQKKQYLVTLALVSSRRNRRSRAQTSIFTIENQHFLVQMAPQASWPSSMPLGLQNHCLGSRAGVISIDSHWNLEVSYEKPMICQDYRSFVWFSFEHLMNFLRIKLACVTHSDLHFREA